MKSINDYRSFLKVHRADFYVLNLSVFRHLEIRGLNF